MTEVEGILKERAKVHGPYSSHSCISQELKRICHNAAGWPPLIDSQRESIDMICHKLARILNGKPNEVDSWLDIEGYAKLARIDTIDKEKSLLNQKL